MLQSQDLCKQFKSRVFQELAVCELVMFYLIEVRDFLMVLLPVSHLCSTPKPRIAVFAQQSTVVGGTAEGGHAVLRKVIFLRRVW